MILTINKISDIDNKILVEAEFNNKKIVLDVFEIYLDKDYNITKSKEEHFMKMYSHKGEDWRDLELSINDYMRPLFAIIEAFCSGEKIKFPIEINGC
jgi:hypothetical protein